MKRVFSLAALVLFLAACAVTPTAIPTQIPASATPAPSFTPTIVWFPPTATPTPYPTISIPPTVDLRPGRGEVLLEEDFSDDKLWNLSSGSAGTVAISKSGLSIVVRQKWADLHGVRSEPSLTDFYLEVDANPNLCKGKDEYGVLFRYSDRAGFYRFALNCDGEAALLNGDTLIKSWTQTGAVPRGAPSVTRLGIWAKGKEMRFFAGDVHLFTVNNANLRSGLIGLYARSASGELLSVNFSHLIVWALND